MRGRRIGVVGVVCLLLLGGASQACADVITVTASSYYDNPSNGVAPPEALVNGAGLLGDADFDGVPEHNNQWRSNMWFSAPNTRIADQWVQFDFGTVVSLETMRIWNFNQISDATAYPLKWKRGVDNAYVKYSVDGINWATATLHVNNGLRSFRPGTGLDTYDNVTNVNFAGALARYVLIDIESSLEGKTDIGYVGLSEVDFTYSLMPEPLSAGLLGLGGLALLRRRRCAA